MAIHMHRNRLAALMLALAATWSCGVPAETESVAPAKVADAAARIKALDEQAQAAWKAKDWARVVDLYTQAIALNPGSA